MSTLDLFEKPSALSFPPPREFQDRTHNLLRTGFFEGHRCQVVCAPTGAGKTYLGLRVCYETVQRKRKDGSPRRALFICDRKTLIKQTDRAAQKYGMPLAGIIQADNPRFDLGRPFQIASAQTLEARGVVDDFDVVVVDECFVAGTMVLTTRGPMRIDGVRCGECVYTATGIGIVQSVFCKPTLTTLRMEFDDGTATECTEDHPFFTRDGWRAAGTVAVGSFLVGVEGLRSLWKAVQPSAERVSERESERARRERVGSADLLLEVLRQENQEPDEQSPVAPEDASDAEAHSASADSARRERTLAAFASARPASRAGRGVGSGVRGEDREAAGVSAFLQPRSGSRRAEDLPRTGRRESRRTGETGVGPKEDRIPGFSRLVRVSRVERASPVPVFNLRVGGHPSYFADGRLVHNCHTEYEVITNYIAATKATVIGLSATPFTKGMAKKYSRVINAATMDALVKLGVLVPMRVISCTSPDMKGAKTKSGEWTPKEAEQRGLTIIGDVVREWLEHAGNAKTIVFGPTIVHCEGLVEKFKAAGVEAACFTAKTDDVERRRLLEEFEKPDSKIRVLISVEALAKGFDVTDVGCVCDCRPLRKSLSTFVQMVGRGLRSHPGKTECLLLDFSGNVRRFAEDFSELYFNGLDELDAGEKLDAKVRKDEETPVRKCPRCGFSPCGKKCIKCGFEKKSTSLLEHQDGRGEEFDVLGLRKKGYAENAAELYAMIATYERLRGGEKAKGRAAYRFKELTGKWPDGFDHTFETAFKPPTLALKKKIRSLQIAFAKRRA